MKTATAAEPATSAPVKRRVRTKPAQQQTELPVEDVRYVNGLKVVSDEPVQTNLPPSKRGHVSYVRGYSLLTLEDKTQVYACSQCEYAGARGDVMKHRNRDHGANIGGRRRAGTPDKNAEFEAAMGMSLGEIVALAVEMNATGAAFDAIKAERDDLRDRLVVAERDLRKFNLMFERLGFVPRDEVDA